MIPDHFGINMIKPTITVQIAYIKQAPAAKSFACLASGCNSGVTKSTTRSMDAFTNSIMNMPKIEITMIIHSNADRPVAAAAITTTIAASK